MEAVRMAASAAVVAKAEVLAVAYDGNGQFSVASGSRPGMVRIVSAPYGTDPDNPVDWTCSCEWAEHGGACCSHVRAAAKWARRELARKRRQAARREVVGVAA